MMLDHRKLVNVDNELQSSSYARQSFMTIYHNFVLVFFGNEKAPIESLHSGNTEESFDTDVDLKFVSFFTPALYRKQSISGTLT